jgi:uncharacterized protein (DUF427 family)
MATPPNLGHSSTPPEATNDYGLQLNQVTHQEAGEMAEERTAEKDVPQESVWDYPRPPRLEPTSRHLRVVHANVVVAETRRAQRILETSHPPVYYFPQEDVAMQWLQHSIRRSSFCEFKGVASYWTLVLADSSIRVPDVAWSYATPSPRYAALQNHLAFYANAVDECWVDGERVVPQPGDFYGGWITSHVKGPFKGAPGTMGW